MGIEELIGKTLTDIVRSYDYGDSLIFETNDNEKYLMYHDQDCCEDVTINEIIGDFDDLINSPILLAEERTSQEDAAGRVAILDTDQDSFTWTFYELRTIKGSVTIRWYGTSNGYYSESVSFKEI